MATVNLRRLQESFRTKQLTDTSFRATVIAVKVVLFALALIAVLFFAVSGVDFQSPRSRSAPKLPVFDAQ